MAKITMLMVVAFMAYVALFALAPTPAHAYNGTFVFDACSAQKTTNGTSLYNAIKGVITDLAQQTPYFSYDYKNTRSNNGVSAHGRGSCKYGLSDCAACLNSVGKVILSACGNAVGARYQVTDCFIEYENHPFC